MEVPHQVGPVSLGYIFQNKLNFGDFLLHKTKFGIDLRLNLKSEVFFRQKKVWDRFGTKPKVWGIF